MATKQVSRRVGQRRRTPRERHLRLVTQSYVRELATTDVERVSLPGGSVSAFRDLPSAAQRAAWDRLAAAVERREAPERAGAVAS